MPWEAANLLHGSGQKLKDEGSASLDAIMDLNTRAQICIASARKLGVVVSLEADKLELRVLIAIIGAYPDAATLRQALTRCETLCDTEAGKSIRDAEMLMIYFMGGYLPTVLGAAYTDEHAENAVKRLPQQMLDEGVQYGLKAARILVDSTQPECKMMLQMIGCIFCGLSHSSDHDGVLPWSVLGCVGKNKHTV